MTAPDPATPPSQPAFDEAGSVVEQDTAVAPVEPESSGDEAGFTVGYVPGVMPGKWFARWRERRMRPVLGDLPVPASGWRQALDDGVVTVCFVRLGWDPADPSLESLRTTHHAVPLYDELRVAVLDAEDVLTVLDTLTLAQLRDEATPQPHADVDDAAMAVELAAAGVGPVVLPMSVARLHARKDVTYRELTDAPTLPVALVWPRGLDEDLEAAVQRLVGVVRGRKETSGRDDAGEPGRGAAPGRAASSSGIAGATTRSGGKTSGQPSSAAQAGAGTKGAEVAKDGTAPASGDAATAQTAAEKTAAKTTGKGQSGGWAKAGASTKPGLRRKPGRKVKNGRNKKRR